ncbi:MAG: hypothetical protein ACI8ZB_005496 [Desulforhopalus sp.]|jgi:hypothetical protein
MLQHLKVLLTRSLQSVLVVASLFFFSYGAHANEWQIGQGKKFSVSQYSSSPLRIASTKGSLRSFAFVGKVGGVNFEEIAQPTPGVHFKHIKLKYDSTQKDGQRLTVTLDKKHFTVHLPDWQLIPIAEYADSKYTAAVSLFGEGPETEKYYYVQYHEAFKDTLLGLRLLQADILFIDLRNNWDLPKLNQNNILGLGESSPNQETSHSPMVKLVQSLDGHSWRSWVLTDSETIPAFLAKDGTFNISANPYYYFWNLKSTAADHERLSNKYQTDYTVYEADIDEYNKKVGEYNASTSQTDRNHLKLEIEELENKLRRLQTNIKMIQEELENPSVIEVESLTKLMRSQAAQLRDYNPAVYNAYLNTAAYASFFRYVKKKDKAAWDRFMSSIKTVKILPVIDTPTTWER